MTLKTFRRCHRAVWAAVILLAAGSARADFVTIGNPNNAADGTGFGAVGYTYQISRTAVTIDEWAAFDNDPASNKVGSFNATYNYWNDGTRNVGPNAPVVNIDFNHAAQYANWLTTGDATSGAYTIDAGTGSVLNMMTRQEILDDGRLFYFIPTEDEWYKAAYYDSNKPGGAGYWLYPTKQDGTIEEPGLTPDHQPVTTVAGTDQYTAVYPDTVTPDPAGPAPVDQSGGLSAYGTMGQGGNVWEWNEAVAVRGGVYEGGPEAPHAYLLASSFRLEREAIQFSERIGLRMALIVPEPGTMLMLLGGVAGMLLWRRPRTVPKPQ